MKQSRDSQGALRSEHRAPHQCAGRIAVVLAVAVAAAMASDFASAGCVVHGPVRNLPNGWTEQEGAPPVVAPLRSDFTVRDASAPGIVGLWKFTMTSDGTAYPTPIPYGVAIDFGTSQWHSDGTEFMISGGRPPSSGDVCMGVWKQVGERTYKLRHIALAWVSSDSVPSVSPAAFLGPAILEATITLSGSRKSYEGTFTIDQYATDALTVLEHIGGTMVAIKVTPD